MLDQRLRSHIDSLVSPVELSEVFERFPNEPTDGASARPSALPQIEDAAPQVVPAQPRWLTAAAIVVLAILTGGLLLVVSRSESPIVTTDEADLPLPVLPDDIADSVWRRVDQPFVPIDDTNATVVRRAVVVDGVAWAVGFEWRVDIANDRVDARKRGAIWRSTDGENWTVVEGDFGSLDVPGGNWVPSGIGFEHVMGTADGVIWVFGNEFRDAIRPVGYRSDDGGETWQGIDVPGAGADGSQLSSVSADDDTILVVVVDDGASPLERTRVLTTRDGRDWTLVDDRPSTSADGFTATLREGEVVTTTNTELPGETTGPRNLLAGRGVLLASGVDGQRSVVTEGEPAEDQTVRLWHSADGAQWAPVVRPEGAASLELEPVLFRHDSGALVAIPRVDDMGAGVSLLNVDADTGAASSLGQLPSATVMSVFVLDGRLVAIGSETSAVLDEASDEDASVWIAESAPKSPSAGASDEALAAGQSGRSIGSCLDVLEAPQQLASQVVVGEDGRLSLNEVELDDRVQLCRLIINEQIELESSGSSTSASPGPISPEQEQALSEGITDLAVEVGWKRFVACMERGGEDVERGLPTGGFEYDYSFEVLWLHDVCFAWHFVHLHSWAAAVHEQEIAPLRQQELERLEVAVEEAWSTRTEHVAALGLGDLLAEIDEASCVVARGDRAWITTFDEMAQARCYVVGEEHDLDFWNKGLVTASVDWGEGERKLTSDSFFETGRVGDVFSTGRHAVRVDPYGDVRLYVLPEATSVMADLRDADALSWDNETSLRGMNAGRLVDLLRIELEATEQGSASQCWMAAVRNDPYSPALVFVGDGSLEGSVFTGLATNEFGCS